MPEARPTIAAAAAPLTTPVFQILLSLVDDELHGYALIQDIRERTGGEVSLTASTLYAALKRLLDAGLIEELDDRPHGGGATIASRRSAAMRRATRHDGSSG